MYKAAREVIAEFLVESNQGLYRLDCHVAELGGRS